MDELFEAVSGVAWLVYLLTFTLVFVETSGLPLPALSFALLAATLAGNGTLDFLTVVLATILGGTLGGPVGHALGLRGGRPMLERMGGKVGLTPERLDSTEVQFKGRGRGLVLARFFVPILPWSAGLFAGVIGMPKRTLSLFTFFSITLWALIELTIVAYFSSVLKDVLLKFGASCLFWLVAGVAGTVVFLRLFRRRREARRAAIEQEKATEAEREPEPPTGSTTPAPSFASLTTTATTTAATTSTPQEPPHDAPGSPGTPPESAGHIPSG